MPLDISVLLLLCSCLLVIAVLYSSVGHGGASGYLAVLVLFGLAPEAMRPVVLAMNVVVTSWVLWRLKPSLFENKSLFLPLVLASVPMAFIGGAWRVSDESYRVILAVLLLIAAIRLLMTAKQNFQTVKPNIVLSLISGAILGFISGLTAIGGGILLSPLLLFLCWSDMRQSIPIVAAFILLNSISGLAGYFSNQGVWPDSAHWLLLAAFLGSLLGAELARKYASSYLLKILLALVLLIASCKMLYTAFF